MSGLSGDQISVRGNASPDEIAAVIAMLAQRHEAGASRYEQWRRTRLAAVRLAPPAGHPPWAR